jgi:GNAT superfamily N-acetyltransferase
VTYALELTEDPGAFLLRSSGLLEGDPVLGTVVATATSRAIDQPPPDHPRWWLSVIDVESGEPVGVPDAAVPLVAAALVERGEEVSALNGVLPTARQLATELARRTGRRAHVHEHTRLHVLRRLVEPRVVPDGRARVALPSDGEVVLAWFRAFHADAAAQAGRLLPEGAEEQFEDEEIATRIVEGRIWLWEDGLGRPVSLVGYQAPSFGVARLGPVYTPGADRGRGYASVLTAHVSRLLRDTGARVCLFTDQANPTSNKIYAAIGYEPVVDMANLVISRAGSRLVTTPARA